MNSIEFLTHDQVCELTGAKNKAGQITVLKRNGIRHTIKRNGWPCVVASSLTGEPISAPEKPAWAPRLVG
ncbi:DUF4224 domain-containing protein [Pseudomonas putida]|uniref:DUF4224 domain-containing protein n=1 Tax=Pseudomonas putida TaxID=303 RepID=A0A2Z4RER4_PSEPU|nr:DUF4224 domain-containing protein [Pseudomonas putida]AWY39447.1 DUF4224 domain-containing protein [Pseudomonas putida]